MMETNLPALFAAVAASVGVYAHGVVGHRWLVGQLGTVEMQPTRLSTRLFGDRDVSWRILGVAWHAVTVVFVASAVVLNLSAFGALESRELLRFIAIIHGAFLAVGLVYVEKRLDALTQPIPAIFLIGMTTAASLAWLASSSI